MGTGLNAKEVDLSNWGIALADGDVVKYLLCSSSVTLHYLFFFSFFIFSGFVSIGKIKSKHSSVWTVQFFFCITAAVKRPQKSRRAKMWCLCSFWRKTCLKVLDQSPLEWGLIGFRGSWFTSNASVGSQCRRQRALYEWGSEWRAAG